tara:strand:- start:3145 stop:3381 length:237 start_codon:yes stop_codon:yes gene_type:complete
MITTELTKGIFKVIRKLVGDSVLLAVIYTIGHILVAITTVRLITGASWFDAGLTALIEPVINGIWFYVLHKIAKRFLK